MFVDDLNGFMLELDGFKKHPSYSWKNLSCSDAVSSQGRVVTGWAYPTERAGIVVIDLDVKNGHDGISSFKKLCLENGFDPDTLTVKTPSGGLHFYFVAPEGDVIKSSASVVADGVDVRAKGGLIVAPGSKVLKDDGTVGEYVVSYLPYDRKIQELPEFLREKLAVKDKAEVLQKFSWSSFTPVAEGEFSAYNVKAIKNAVSEMESTIEGCRNETLNRLAYGLGQLPEMDRMDASALVSAAVLAGLPSGEAENVFNRAFSEGEREKRNVTPFSDWFESNRQLKQPAKRKTVNNVDVLPASESLKWTDTELGAWFSEKNSVAYVTDTKSWLAYSDSDGFWRDDESVKLKVRVFLRDLATKLEKRNASGDAKLASRLLSGLTVTNVLGAVKDFNSCKREDFDSDPMLLSVKNGVIDFRERKLIKPTADMMITKHVDVNWVEGARNELCDKAISALPDDAVKWVQLMTGQGLIGEQPASSVAVFLHGGGANGKSVFLNLLSATSGTYAAKPLQTVLMKNNRDQFSLISFEGARTSILEELPDDRYLDTGALKRLLGTDELTARGMRENYRTIKNQSTLFISTNNLPNVDSQDAATWRRLLVLPFMFTFLRSGGGIYREGDSRMATAYRDRETLEAFLAWRVEGAFRWVEGRADLEREIPASVVKASAEWRHETDVIKEFFDENLSTGKEKDVVPLNQLYWAYQQWASQKGGGVLSERSFRQRWAQTMGEPVRVKTPSAEYRINQCPQTYAPKFSKRGTFYAGYVWAL